MYAVVKTGGKQYRVKEGDLITVEKVEGEVGSDVDLGPALMTFDGKTVKVGETLEKGPVVKAKIVAQGKGPKIVILKHLKRKDSRKKTGHRQNLTKVEITSIK